MADNLMNNEQFIDKLMAKFAATKQAEDPTYGYRTMGGRNLRQVPIGISRYNPGRWGDLVMDTAYGGAGPLADSHVYAPPGTDTTFFQPTQTALNALGNTVTWGGAAAAGQRYLPDLWQRLTNPDTYALMTQPINAGSDAQILTRLTNRGFPSTNNAIAAGTRSTSAIPFEGAMQENVQFPATVKTEDGKGKGKGGPTPLNSQQLAQAIQIQKIVPNANMQIVSQLLAQGVSADDVATFVKMQESGVGDPNVFTTKNFQNYLRAKAKNPDLTFVQHSGQAVDPGAFSGNAPKPIGPYVPKYKFDYNTLTIVEDPKVKADYERRLAQYQAIEAAYNDRLTQHQAAEARYKAMMDAETAARQTAVGARASGASGATTPPASKIVNTATQPQGNPTKWQKFRQGMSNPTLDLSKPFLSMRNSRLHPLLFPLAAGGGAAAIDGFIRGTAPTIGVGSFDSGPGIDDPIVFGEQGPVRAFGAQPIGPGAAGVPNHRLPQ